MSDPYIFYLPGSLVLDPFFNILSNRGRWRILLLGLGFLAAFLDLRLILCLPCTLGPCRRYCPGGGGYPGFELRQGELVDRVDGAD